MIRKFSGNDKLLSDRAFWLGLGIYAFFLILATIAFGGNVSRSQTDFASEVNGTVIQLAGQPSLNRRPPPDVNQAPPDLGDLTRWTLFSEGRDGLDLSGSSVVVGDVDAAGNGTDILSGYATIDGNLYYSPDRRIFIRGNAQVTGTLYQDRSAEMDNAASEATTASKHAFALTPTRSYRNIDLRRNQNATVQGSPGETVVLKLQNFVMQGSASFTLQGTATTNFVINVTEQFSLSKNANIVLSGGVQWNNVLFNVIGHGPDIHLRGSAHFEGILMANHRTVRLSGQSRVIGEVMAKRILMSKESRVSHPSVISP